MALAATQGPLFRCQPLTSNHVRVQLSSIHPSGPMKRETFNPFSSREFPKRLRLVLISAVLTLCVLVSRVCLAADQAAKHTLDDYLKKLQYEPIPAEKVASPGGSEPGLQNEILVRGELGNGKKPLFLVDTGWGLTTLDQAVAIGLKTPSESGVVLEDSVLGQITNASAVIMDKLKLGRAEFFNQPARSVKLEMDYVNVKFAGLLGIDFLARNFCIVDCASKRLYVRAGEASSDQKTALKETLLRSGYIEVRGWLRGGMLVEVEINNHRFNLMVDTGSDFTTLDSAEAKRLGLSPVKEDHPAIGSLMPEQYGGRMIGVGKVGAHEFKVATVRNMKLGKRTLSTVHVGTVDLSNWHLGKPGTAGANTYGLLGSDLLRANGALIDFDSGTLWLAPAN